jgi:hypothetical protein
MKSETLQTHVIQEVALLLPRNIVVAAKYRGGRATRIPSSLTFV